MQTYTAFFNDWCLCIEMKRHRKQVPEKSHKRESCLGGYFLVIYLIVYLRSGLFCPGAFCTIRKVLVCSHTGFILNSGPSVTRRPFMLLSNSMLSPSFPFPMWLPLSPQIFSTSTQLISWCSILLRKKVFRGKLSKVPPSHCSTACICWILCFPPCSPGWCPFPCRNSTGALEAVFLDHSWT